jgi:hypothetical protein
LFPPFRDGETRAPSPSTPLYPPLNEKARALKKYPEPSRRPVTPAIPGAPVVTVRRARKRAIGKNSGTSKTDPPRKNNLPGRGAGERTEIVESLSHNTNGRGVEE